MAVGVATLRRYCQVAVVLSGMLVGAAANLAMAGLEGLPTVPPQFHMVPSELNANAIEATGGGSEIGLYEAVRQHWRWVALMVLALVLLTLRVIYAMRLNLHNPEIHHALQAEMAAKSRSEQALQASQKIEENEQRLAAILDNVLEAVITSDHAGNIQTFNRAAEAIFGYRQEEVTGRNVSMLMPQPDAVRHGRFMQDYIRTGRAKIIGIGRESQGMRKDGEVFPLELAVSEVALRGQRMFIGIMRDLTEKKAHEMRQRRMEKLEAVAKMAGGFAHEFNNLLSSIVGYTDMLLLDLAAEPDRAADLERVMNAAVRAKLLVRQLLDISRSDYAEALALMPQKIVTEVVDLLQGLLPEGAEIHSDLDQSARHIRMSPYQFQQIIMNLGMNAIAALAKGGHIDITLKFVEMGANAVAGKENLAAGEYAVLSVCDDDRFMDADMLAEIFGSAFTNHDMVEDQLVGLAALKGIVSRHHGLIEVESEVGKGTCFRVYLPCD